MGGAVPARTHPVPARTTAQITTTQSLEAPPGILDRGSASKSLKLAYILITLH